MKLCILALLVLPVSAGQPIFNALPRWDGGYGIQFLQEFITESELLDGGRNEVGDGLTEKVHLLRIEGVYTWDRSVRLTAKLPVVLDAEREIIDEEGNVIRQRDSGVGALTLALPLKRYFNETDKSGSWTVAPQLRVPLRSKTEYDFIDPVWGGGLSLGYEQETANYFFSTGVTGWFLEGDEEDELQYELSLGWNFNTRGQLLAETSFLYEFDGSYTLSAGPALYYRFSDLVHTRIEWKADIVDVSNTLDHGNGYRVSVGLGFVW